MDLPQELNLTKLSPNAAMPSKLHGLEFFQEELKARWRDFRTTGFGWLERVTDLEGGLAMSAEQTQRTWHGPRHWPPPSLVHAFTLSRSGQVQDAVAQLNAIVDVEVTDPNGLLVSALEKIAAL